MVSMDIFSPKILECLKAPGYSDDHELQQSAEGLYCPSTGETFPHIEGIPSLYKPVPWEDPSVSSKVKSFYEENPFPNYEGLEEFGELVSKGYKNPFSRDLLRAVGYNKLVLECGCGTGQLTHFLQLNNNHVLGIDLSLNSLALALDHKHRNRLTRSTFAQMNIFELAIKDSAFDVVISHGVLHHTFDAKRAFTEMVRKVKPGGIIMVGLYNYFARVPTWIRAKLIGILGPKIDYVVRSRIRDVRKAGIWIKDQYYNPHETWHSIDEVLGWFKESNVEYLNTSPPILGTSGEASENLFEKTDAGNKTQRIVTQLSWLGTIAREGALFDVIGRKVA